jgi:VanZ family protein
VAAGHSQAEIAVAYRGSTPSPGHRFAAWALLYAAVMAYSSLAIGPGGFYFAPLDPIEAWHRFLATPLVNNGSDQRPDWIANLLLTIPLGFLVTGAFASVRAAAWRVFGTILALVFSLGFVLAVKYAQLFFPPRTVTLNYIIAQSIGVCIGVAMLHLARAVMPSWAARDEPAKFRLLLDVAIVALVAYALYPFDLVLSADDWHERLVSLPPSLLAWPWSDRPAAMRLILIGATAASVSPIGMRLALRGDHPGLARIAVVGTAWMIVLLLASMMILSAAPSLATLVCRIAGIVAGAVAMRWLMAQDLRRGQFALARLVVPLVPAYLVLLFYVQGLFDPHWQTPAQALAALDTRGLPLRANNSETSTPREFRP